MAYGRRPRYFGESISTGIGRQRRATTGRGGRDREFRFGRIGRAHLGLGPEPEEMDYAPEPEAPAPAVAQEPAEESSAVADPEMHGGMSLADKMRGYAEEMGWERDPSADLALGEQAKTFAGSLLGRTARLGQRQTAIGLTSQQVYASKPQTAIGIARFGRVLGPVSGPFIGLGMSLDMQRAKAQKEYNAYRRHSPERMQELEAKFGPEMKRLGLEMVDWDALPADSPVKGREVAPSLDFSHRRDPFSYTGPQPMSRRLGAQLRADIEPYGAQKDRALGAAVSPATIADFDPISRETGPGVTPGLDTTDFGTDVAPGPGEGEAGTGTDLGGDGGGGLGHGGGGGLGGGVGGEGDVGSGDTGAGLGPGHGGDADTDADGGWGNW